MTMMLQPYETEWARTKVDWFVLQFGKAYRTLASYAALPLVLTPDLLHFLRMRFLPDQVPYVAEADLLLSDLCAEVGYEQFMMDSAVRGYLLSEMRNDPKGAEQMEQIAQALIKYVNHLAQTDPFLSKDERQLQQWAALAYLKDKRATLARDLALELRACIMPDRAHTNDTALMRLTGIVQTLAPELSSYTTLIDFAMQVRRILSEAAPQIAGKDLDRPITVLGVDLPAPAALLPSALEVPNEPPTVSPTLVALIRELVVATNIGVPTLYGEVERATDYLQVLSDLRTMRSYHYGGMRHEAHAFIHNEASRDRLRHYADDFRQYIQRITAIAAQAAFKGQGKAWITRLDESSANLVQAIARRNADQLSQELRLIQRRLDFLQSWVSAHLISMQRELPLASLVESLHTLEAEAAGRGYDTKVVSALESAIGQLTTLQLRMAALIDEHNHWQRVDFSLRWIDDALKRDAGALAQLWPDARAQVQPLAADDVGQSLRREGEQIEQALAINNRAAAGQHFSNYRSRVNIQLTQTVQKLKQLCGALQQIDQEIVALLGKIE